MAGNQTLAGFDMVLGLSQTTINYQFQQLHRRNLIPRQWAVLFNNVFRSEEDLPTTILTNADDTFSSTLDRWVSIQRDISQARNNNDWVQVGQLSSQRDEEGFNFELGWDAQTEPPEINIRNRDTQNLSFIVHFRSGTLYYRHDEISEVETFDLRGFTYAFTVPIGQLRIDQNQMTSEAQAQLQTVIRDSGLTANDFRIESLFLNFTNANITAFDAGLSDFPEGYTQRLQTGVQNYFNLMLADSDNPYILGYGVSMPELESNEDALFQPTSVEFSTSYSNRLVPETSEPGPYSAFNFLMMLNYASPERNQNTGILSSSLIELATDNDSSNDGVFAIQYDRFQQYINTLDQFVEQEFSDMAGVNIRSSFDNGVMEAVHTENRVDDEIVTTMTVERQPMTERESGTLTIRYQLSVNVRVNVYAWILRVGSVVLNTSGRYTRGAIDEQGAPGYLDFKISTGTNGRFQMEPEYTAPRIAFRDNPDLFSGTFWNILGQLVLYIIAPTTLVIHAIVQQIAVDLGQRGANNASNRVKVLQDVDVLNQSNAVILPMPEIFTFRNLRYHTDLGIISYDVAYAPNAN